MGTNLPTFCCLTVSGLLLATHAGFCEQQETVFDIPFTKHVLKNGLTLLVHEDHKAPIVTVNIWYHVGSKNEIEGRTGFAHLFEHLMFNGSKNFNDDYFKLVEPEGATTLNGTTDFDRTNYFEDAPVSALDLILWAESDRMGFLLDAIDQAKLDEQRGVVLNEKRQGENQPYGKVFRLLFEGLFPKGHPYSWTPIGFTEDLESASLADVHGWFTNYYGAANAYICLAGDITPEQAREKVEKYFGSIPAGPPVSRPAVWVPRLTGTKRIVSQDRVNLPALFQIWPVPPMHSPESDELSLVAEILSAGKTSRLYKRLVYDDQIAVDVSAIAYTMEIAGIFGVQVLARPGIDLAVAEKAVDEEVARFLREGPTPDELLRAKTRQVAGFIRGAERIGGFGGKSDILLRNQVLADDPAHYKVSLKRIQDATADQLTRTAKAWLEDGKTVLEVHPFPDREVAKDTLDRSVRPEVQAPAKARLPEFTRFDLPNGLKVILMENHSIPVVLFRTVLDGGSAADPADLPGLATMTMDMLDEGTKTRTTLQISDELNLMGAQLGAGATADQCTIDLNTLKSTWEKALDLYTDVLFNPVFPDKELARLKKERLAAIEMEKSAPEAMAMRALPKLIYGAEHPYGVPMSGTGTEEAASGLSQADVKSYYESRACPNNATLIIVGDTSLSEIRPVIEKRFGAWAKKEVKPIQVAPVQHHESSTAYIIDKPGAEQSVIFAGHVAPPPASPEEIPMRIVNSLLGGKFSSRVNMNLREDKHWSYGARTQLIPARGQRPFIVMAPVQTDKTGLSIRELKKELEEITEKRPATETELKETCKQEMLSLAGQWETMQGQLSALTELLWFGFPDDFWSTYADKISKVSLENAHQAARTLVHPGSLVWVIVGDRKRVEAEVQEELGKIQLINTEAEPVGASL